MRKIILIFLLPLALNANPSAFTLANEAYQTSDYDRAIALYEESLKNIHSLEQHYNIANTYHQKKAYGKAILHYDKALTFDPSNPDVIANINLTKDALKMDEIHNPSTLKILVHIFSIDEWTWLFVSCFWIFVAILSLSKVYTINDLFRNTISWVTAMVGLCALSALLYFQTQKDIGVVLTEKAKLRVSPTSISPTTTELAESSTAKTLDSHEDYFYILTPKKEEGWIHKSDFEKVLN